MNALTPPSGYRIEQALGIADALRRRLLADDPDLAADETALRDTLDGQTDVYDLVRRLIRFSLEAGALADAARDRADALAKRKARFERRAEAARGAAFGMLDALGETKLSDAEFTLSIGQGRPAVIVTDESLLPSEFVRITRAPDKAAIAEALKSGVTVPGAEMTNGTPTLTVRTL